MIELSVIRDLVTIFGVLAGFSYYVLTVRANSRNQQLQLETRQTQLYMQIYQQIADEKFGKNYVEFMNMTWLNYDDFEKKYGSDEHPENYSMRWNLWYLIDGVGYILRRNMIDVETVVNLGGGMFLMVWEKSKELIIEQRRRYKIPFLLDNFEYLVNDINRWSHEHGRAYDFPSTFLKYVPEK